jgi:hypothetical protein
VKVRATLSVREPGATGLRGRAHRAPVARAAHPGSEGVENGREAPAHARGWKLRLRRLPDAGAGKGCVGVRSERSALPGQ